MWSFHKLRKHVLGSFDYILTSDEFELKFSSSSQAELWRFRAEPSQAGALQFPSWNRAEIFLSPIKNYNQNFPIFL